MVYVVLFLIVSVKCGVVHVLMFLTVFVLGIVHILHNHDRGRVKAQLMRGGASAKVIMYYMKVFVQLVS